MSCISLIQRRVSQGRLAIFLAACCAWCTSINAPVAEAESIKLSGRIFGTTYNISARPADQNEGLDRERVQTDVEARLNEIDRLMSTYRDDSDVSRFNAAAAGTWFSVDAETVRVVALSQQISNWTDGAFDVTVAPAVRLWNFGSGSSDTFSLPSPAEIAATQSIVGGAKLEVRSDPPALRKLVEGLEVDLSAIAKGYAVDEVCQLLESVDHYMVEIGGEVRVKGSNRDGSPWRIGIELPVKGKRRMDAIVSLDNMALATSGDYRNFFEHEGVSYSHTIDPKTCRPVEHQLASVTVLAETCAQADAWATAISVMGPEVGYRWAESNGVPAMMMTRANDGFKRQTTSTFPTPNIQPSEDKMDASDAHANSNFLQLFLVTAVVFGIAILAMSLGTIIANRRLQGSCGGIAGLKDTEGKTMCELCTKPSPECSGSPDEEVSAEG